MKRIFVLVLIAFVTLNLTGNVVGVFANKDNFDFQLDLSSLNLLLNARGYQ